MLRLFLVIGMLSCISSMAQPVIQVRDYQSGTVLKGAVLQCEDAAPVPLPSEYSSAWLTAGCEIRYTGYDPYLIQASAITDTVVVLLRQSTRILSEIIVQGYQENVRLAEVPGSYGYIDRRELQQFYDVSPLQAFNLVPGVRMEQRSPGSYRFNIRGSTLRSPFGVRNVKVYWKGIPYTEATGSTPINMLDVGFLNSAEIIRGPAGSVYGSGIGGVILLNGDENVQTGINLSGGIALGGYGMFNGDVDFTRKTESGYVRIRGSSIHTDGYREHSRMDRQNITLNGSISLAENHDLQYAIAYTDLEYELPGGITEEQRDQDPQAAREAAILQDARIDQNYLLGGLTHLYETNKTKWQSSAFFTSSRKVNPFVTNYEIEDLGGGGVRTVYERQFSDEFRFTIGGEWQWGVQQAVNFGNNGGTPDTLRFEDDNNQFTGFEFLKVSYNTDEWFASAGVSFNHLNYNFDRGSDVALDSAYSISRTFGTVVSPRFAVVRKFAGWNIHGSYSLGFSPPTLDEIRTSDGTINEDLVPERGHNVEVGVRGNFIDNRLTIDVNLFQLWQTNTIVNQVEEGGFNTFNNSGSTSQRGIEALIGYLVPVASDWNLYLQTAATLNHFRFTDYVRSSRGENVDYSGNKLTGAPGTTFSSRINVKKGDWSVELRHLFVNEIPLNDANTVFSRAYHLVNLVVNWELSPGEGVRLRLYAGVDNLLNQSYSLGNDLNAFGARYFNPAAEINGYGGIRVYFHSD